MTSTENQAIDLSTATVPVGDSVRIGSHAQPPRHRNPVPISRATERLDRAELCDLLNQLLEAETAGARGVHAMSRRTEDSACRAALRDVALDEARFCSMLDHHIRRLGGKPSRKVGAFQQKLAAVERLPEQLNLLNRGQGWVVRKISELLPQIRNRELRDDLTRMLSVHRRNIELCAMFEEKLGERSDG